LNDPSSRDAVANERNSVGRFFYRFKCGESGADVYDRVSSFMESLYRDMDYHLLPNNNICIVSHGLFMRLFIMRYFRWTVDKYHTLKNFENCDYCILERDDRNEYYSLKTELNTYDDIKQ
jgi:broad specificity phosphatase PhoE